MTPKVSILIPVFNRENMIGECIASATSQTIDDLEVIVVDNQSSDATWQICREWAAKDKRVRIFRNETNIGPVRNWQRCIAEARGTYGKLLFSDDLMEPHCLEKCLPYLDEQGVGFVFSAVVISPTPWIGEASFRFQSFSGTLPSTEYVKEALFGDQAPVSPAAGLFRLSDLRKNLMLSVPSQLVRDFHAHGAGPDMLLYLLTAVGYSTVAYHHEPLMYFRAHQGSISVTTNQNYLHHAYRQCRIWFAERFLDPPTVQKVYALEWKRHCKKERSWGLPSKALRIYTEQYSFFGFNEMLHVLVKHSKDWKKQVTVKYADQH